MHWQRLSYSGIYWNYDSCRWGHLARNA